MVSKERLDFLEWNRCNGVKLGENRENGQKLEKMAKNLQNMTKNGIKMEK